MVFDVASITDGENAVNVLGQSDFTTSSNATAQNRMYLAFSAALDFTGNRLFVSDLGNNRVLIFDIAAITNGENAVNVLGQADFTTGSYARTQGRLREPREISYDPQGNRLFVADYANHRVMVFDVASVTDGENAVKVLGQSNFTAGSTLITQAGMDYPVGAAFDSVTQRLFISHPSGNRVMVFDVATITDGENAVNVIGQGDFTSAVSATTQSGLYNPFGLTLDSGAQRLCVVDRYNKRVLMHDVSTTTISNGANAENVVGQTDDVGGGVYTTRNLHDGLPAVGFSNPINVLVDTTSHRLFVSDFNSNRVAVYNLDTSNTLVDRIIDNVIGQGLVTQGLGLTSQSTMSRPQGLAMDLATNRLFVSDYGGDRVMVFDVTTITDGENAVNVLGQTSFTAGSSATSQSRLYVPAGLAYEAGNSRLYVADQGNHRVLVFNVASITEWRERRQRVDGRFYDRHIGGLAQNRVASPWGVYHDGASRLYVGDQSNQRVLVFDTTAITDGENAVNVLGQNNFTSNGSGASQSALNQPKSFAMDTQINRLFVSDYNNHRVLVFDVAAITDGENAANVLGQLNFTGNSAATSQSRMYSPTGLSYDSGMNRLYVAEYYNNRMLVHSVGPVAPSSSTLTASTGVGAGKMDVSWASAGDDGAFNNLTGYYRIQYATYTATWSTSTTPTNAYTSTITATNVSPGVVQSTTIVVSPTTPQTWYFVLWTADEVGNWSPISSTATASPPFIIPDYGVGPFDVTSVGGGLSQGGTAWGDFDNDGDLDVVVSGTDGTNNQVRVYKSNGNGTFNSTAVNVAAANSGLKDGDVAWADFDIDGDLDVLAGGYDGSNRQLRVYKNNGNGTFNTAGVEVPGSANLGLSTGTVACGDFDNDGDLDVLA
ncbi:MAG: VCBS repeat-containing protein, partial [Elusimicrobia bacterium]|nr:VCBS repeat-containing protein [Elusimicrobiota bacterium]